MGSDAEDLRGCEEDSVTTVKKGTGPVILGSVVQEEEPSGVM